MQNPLREALDQHHSVWQLLMVLIMMVLSGLLTFNIVGIGISMVFFDFDVEKTILAFGNPTADNSMKVPLLLLQGIISLGTFIFIPALLMRWHRLGNPIHLFRVRSQWPSVALITAMITFSFMVVNSMIIQWNMGITLPESMYWFESWARQKEDELGLLTEYITSFSGPGQFVLALMVVGVLPAIGEELLFRGFLQNIFSKITSNPHIAIWFTGFLFAAFHAQFFGIFPRMLLGVLFGYLYFWSGSLTYPMIAHFVNNGFMLTMVYLKDLGMISYDIEAENTSPPPVIIVTFAVITIGLLFLFYRHFKSQQNGGMAKSI